MPSSNRRASLIRLSLAIMLSSGAGFAAYAQDAKPAETPPPAAAQPAPKPAPDTVLAKVNGQSITEADLDLAIEDLDQQFARLPEEQKRAAALSAVIEIKLMAAEAAAKGIDKDADMQRRLAFLQQRALHAAVIDKEVQAKITDDEIRARYDKEIAAQPAENEVHARHILVKTKEEAEAIIKDLDAGKKFEDIAKEKSTDPGSGANGGDLGYFSAGQMVPEFEKAAFALAPGTYTKTPVQTQFGFHVIKVEDKRAKQPPAFDEVKDQVRSLVLRDKYLALIKSLREAAKIQIDDPALKKSVEGMEAPKP
ncbi:MULTISPECIES: peptidylprolyl isomerase [Mesorhizobium]|uniref:Parvulin-like PPIase n=1 Tax=Mesorhizobium denitrificans TaxID=2294114 RepID=A0A371XFZ8_9HYPH|nr:MULTISPECIES: peptidylprolyl isomerase [Mesorhizobium]RFC67954.1 peptidylprolyl isomerase [Mesorhizobium denitrificans]